MSAEGLAVVFGGGPEARRFAEACDVAYGHEGACVCSALSGQEPLAAALDAVIVEAWGITAAEGRARILAALEAQGLTCWVGER